MSPSQNAQRTARSTAPVRDVRVVRPLEHGQVLGLVAEQVGGGGQPLEILAAELAGGRQGGMGVLPRPSSEGLPAVLHVIGGVHPLVR